MGTFFLDFIILLLLLILNGVLAMAELAVVSARKPRLKQMADDGDENARAALALAEEPGDFLSAIQIGITLVGIITGAFGGARLSVPVAELLNQAPFLAPYSESLAVAFVVLLTTYLALVVGELTPKRVALNNPEKIATQVARPMQLLARLSHPLVVLLDRSSAALVRLMGIQPNLQPLVTEDEVRVMLEQGTEVGVFEEIEEKMVTSIFRLSDRRVSAIMTPRTEIAWIDVGDRPPEVRQLIAQTGHSRYPLASDNLDHVVGIILVKDLIGQEVKGGEFGWHDLAHPALFVPESMTVLDALERMQETRNTLCLIINEFGGLEGLVTITDVMEAIVGAIEADGLDETPAIVQREDGSWLVDGMLSVDEFQEHFDLEVLPQHEELGYQTVGGLVMTVLERVPTVGSHVRVGPYRIEVVDMDGRRVDKVLVTG